MTYGFEIEPVNRRVASSNLAQGATFSFFAAGKSGRGDHGRNRDFLFPQDLQTA
jgi:hypothetical protein